jgi:DNA-binding HxlR family transcriptional regulator
MTERQERFKDLVEKLLMDKNLSISAIQRQLEELGFKEHRLILTGYLRAMRDLGIIEEVEVPPSKIYSLISREEESKLSFYDLIEQGIDELNEDDEARLVLAVLIINTLFHRPAFRAELKRMGIKDVYTRSLHKVEGKAYLSQIDQNKLTIPENDPAFECDYEVVSTQAFEMMIRVLSTILKEVVDVNGLYEKYPQTTLFAPNL